MKIQAKIKIGVFFALVIGFFLVKELTPVGEQLTVENLRLLIEPLGAWGALLFVAAFVLGTIVQIPGILFYSASFLIFGSLLGGIIAYIGSILAVIGSFYFARHMGGTMLEHIRNERIKSWLIRLERQPVLVVGILRTFMWVSPPLNYALAFSSIPSRKYIIGSVLGLAVPAVCMGLGANCFF